ncbi:MAG: sensor histidine kinase, partial [Nocardioidaceae bacterium]
MQQPTPEQYQPPLTPWRTLWRTVAMIAISAFIWWSVAPLQWRDHRWLFWLDLGAGVVSFGLSFFRRRWPLPIALITNVMGVFSTTAAGPATLATVSLATRRRLGEIVSVAAVGLAAAWTSSLFEPSATPTPWWVTIAVALAYSVAMMASGMYIGSRRELLWTLRDRANRAEAEQESRVRQAQTSERARIAREMHDVLAHRISLVTMHAGALAYRDDLTPGEIRQTAQLIQSKAHEALSDLRQVLGVLRGDEPGAPDRPQPTFGDLHQLVHEAEGAGMRVSFEDSVDGAASMPTQVGRTTYRIIQEGLTNARKHAPGALVLVTVS